MQTDYALSARRAERVSGLYGRRGTFGRTPGDDGPVIDAIQKRVVLHAARSQSPVERWRPFHCGQ